MHWLDSIRTATPETAIALRLVLAATLGAVIGLEREYEARPAGFRTHMLTALAAAVFTVITFELLHEARKTDVPGPADPIRVIEAVTAGVAFLAAGAIIQARGQVQGLTTGAAWLAGAVGVACGGGYYIIGLMATVLALVILTVLTYLERRIEASQAPNARGRPAPPSEHRD